MIRDPFHTAAQSASIPPFLRNRPVPAAQNEAIQSRFGRRLRTLRVQRNWTQLRMAVEFGIDRGFISDVERGRKTVSLRMLDVFALGLKMSLSDLLQDI